MTQPVLDFWFEFASTYSYPAAMRIEALAQEHGVSVRYRPFLLGPIFKAQGWTTSPFNLFEAKGRYMWRDLERICADLRLPFRRPDPFPQSSLLATRAALVAIEHRFEAPFCRSVYSAQFADGLRIDEVDTLASILTALKHDPVPILTEARSDEIKTRLRLQTEEAQALGLFGAPSFVTGKGEIFWGNDRLEQALAWASRFPSSC